MLVLSCAVAFSLAPFVPMDIKELLISFAAGGASRDEPDCPVAEPKSSDCGASSFAADISVYLAWQHPI